MNDVTRILSAIEQGDAHAAEQLLPLVYDELRRLAAQKLVHEKPGQTLDATALVHEAYLRLVDAEKVPAWNCRGHFFAAAAEAMRRILVENARRKGRIRHGGGRRRVELDEACLVAATPRDDVLALDEALARLAKLDPVRAELVKLRFFAGLTMPEAAALLGISLTTAERYWTFARTWLYAERRSSGAGTPPASSCRGRGGAPVACNGSFGRVGNGGALNSARRAPVGGHPYQGLGQAAMTVTALVRRPACAPAADPRSLRARQRPRPRPPRALAKSDKGDPPSAEVVVQLTGLSA
jgi:RNA polymerase sigma factor (TIGR02999 family)